MESLARTQVGKAPREHFVKAVHDELANFERKEIEFQKMERDQRAARLRLPIGKVLFSTVRIREHVPILKVLLPENKRDRGRWSWPRISSGYQ